MDVLFLARLQFAITTIFHFFFVPLSIGMAIFIAILETRYVRSGDAALKKTVKFWGKLFVILFAMGVASGIVQEFQFGMNWSGYSRYVGDIFGAPLAIEALLAFFIESTFLGLWLFGWEKLSKKVHAACMWLVAFGTTISAYWILTANSFMQAPVGYQINEATGRAELVDFLALITNPHTFFQFGHVIAAALCTAGFLVLAVSGYHIVRKRDSAVFQKVFRQGAAFALIGTLSVVLVGHFQGQYLVKHQPMKMSAAEMHWNTSDPADLDIIAWPAKEGGENVFEISIPGFLSFMSYNQFGLPVEGINDLQAEMEAEYGPGDYTPPVILTFYSFRIMFGAGLLMILLALLALLWSGKSKIGRHTKFLRFLIICTLLPFVANTCGWLFAEVGRQPWIVYGLQTVAQGVSSVVTAPAVLTTLIGFTAVYSALTGVCVFLLIKHSKKGLAGVTAPGEEPLAEPEAPVEEDAPKTKRKKKEGKAAWT